MQHSKIFFKRQKHSFLKPRTDIQKNRQTDRRTDMQMDVRTGRKADGQEDRHTKGQIEHKDTQIHRQIICKIVGEMNRKTKILTDSYTEKQIGRETNRCTDVQKDRNTNVRID